MKITRTGPIVGAEIQGLQTAYGISDDIADALRRLVAHYGVLVLRDQDLNAEQHRAFTARFGELESFPGYADSTREQIFRVSNDGDGFDVGHYWHADGAPWPRPTELSTLLAVEVPTNPLTHTCFLSAAAAYAALPLELRDAVAGRQLTLGSKVRAPILRAHPNTGVPVLFLPFRFPNAAARDDASLRQQLGLMNSNVLPHIEGMSTADSEATILALVRVAISDKSWQYRHEWMAGDLVLWDQATVYHHAEASKSRRVLHRTAVKGRSALPYVAEASRHLAEAL